MKEQIAKIKEEALKEIQNSNDLQTLNDVKVKYLGKKGELTGKSFKKNRSRVWELFCMWSK